MRPRLHGHATGDFAHRGQERQAAVGIRDRFIGDAGGTTLEQFLGLGNIWCKVQIGEKKLTLAELFAFGFLRLLDLHDQVRPTPNCIGVNGNGGACGDIHLVGGTNAGAGAGLDRHLVAVGDKFAHTCGRQPDPSLSDLDFLRHANMHRPSSPGIDLLSATYAFWRAQSLKDCVLMISHMHDSCVPYPFAVVFVHARP